MTETQQILYWQLRDLGKTHEEALELVLNPSGNKK